MEFVWFIIVGLVAGWLAGVIMKGGGFGVIGDIVVGIVGAVISGLLFGVNMNAGITVESFLYALLGAVILLAIVNLIRRGSVR